MIEVKLFVNFWIEVGVEAQRCSQAPWRNHWNDKCVDIAALGPTRSDRTPIQRVDTVTMAIATTVMGPADTISAVMRIS